MPVNERDFVNLQQFVNDGNEGLFLVGMTEQSIHDQSNWNVLVLNFNGLKIRDPA